MRDSYQTFIEKGALTLSFSSPVLCEWVARRYAEKCDFSNAQSYFKRKRDLLTPLPNYEDTLSLWTAFPNQNKAAFVALGEQAALSDFIKASQSKRLWNQHGTSEELSEKVVTAKRQDFSSFGGKHEDADVMIYKVPLQGWEGAS